VIATHRPRVLVVEDDARLAQMIASELRMAGYDVHQATSGTGALEAAAYERFDAVLLDLGLPDMDGLEVARALRHDGGPAILAVTARSALEDRVEGLYAGADDYITKPFSMLELRARLHAHLRVRRTNGESLEFGSLQLEPLERRCRVKGQDVALSAREFDLLVVLARRPGRIFSQLELSELTYGEAEPDSNTLEVRVSSIRRKLREAGLEGAIRTVRGAGYAFREPVA
jgi:two-component system, OmpR family, response regulator QseB